MMGLKSEAELAKCMIRYRLEGTGKYVAVMPANQHAFKLDASRIEGLAQMAKYEREELKQLKVNVLKDILEFLDVNFERKNKDVLYHVDLIVNQQRLLASAQAFAGGFKAWRERGVSQDRGMDSQNV